MSIPRSTIRNVSGLCDSVTGTKTWEAKITSNRESVAARGSTPREAQSRASKKYNDR